MVALVLSAAAAFAAAPPNDNFSAPISLSGYVANLAGQTTAEATAESGEPSHTDGLRPDCSDATTPDSGCLTSVWYSWTAPQTGHVTIVSCLAGNRGGFQIPVAYTGDALNSLTKVSDADFPRDPATAGCDTDFAAVLRFSVTAGVHYRIVVGGFQASAADFDLHLFQQSPPLNDNFTAATSLSGDSVDLGGQTTVAATGESGEPDHAGASLGSGCVSAMDPDPVCLSSVWYTWSSPSPALVTIDLCDPETTVDSTVGVYTGAAVNALSEVASNDDAMPACSGQDESVFASRVSFTATAATTYRIAVADYARQGRFTLHLRASPVPPPGGTSSRGPTSTATVGGSDTSAPGVSSYGVTNDPFVVGGRTPTFGSAAKAKRHKKGTTFRYTLSETATVKIVISQRRAGRRRDKRCVAPTRRLRKAKKCIRVITKGTLTRTSKQGANNVAFSGRIGSKALSPGRYQATLTAADPAKNTSKPKTISFTIVKR